MRRALLLALALLWPLQAPALGSFVSFETGQVRPLALSPDGARLYAVNTPDNQLEIFDVLPNGLRHLESVPVGMEPCAVAARSNGEVWVVNHLSDSISILDVATSPARVTRTLWVGDEPRDLVFAGVPVGGPGGPFPRAFITTAHRGQNSTLSPQLTSEGVGRADVWVFDATNLGSSPGGDPLTVVTLFGDTPRALAATPDGSRVFAAIFHSGNRTTAVTEQAVCNGGSAAAPCNLDGVTVPGGLPGGQVPGGLPAPNDNHALLGGPEVGLIIQFDGSLWTDELGRNWNNAVRFDLPDLDVFEIDAVATPPVELSSVPGAGTVLFNMVVNPQNGKLYVSNTEANNAVRFEGEGLYAGPFKPAGEPASVRGHLHEARITVVDGASVTPRHLNKHIVYDAIPQPAGTKQDSLATPVGMAVTGDGSTLYVAAFGSNKIGVFDTNELENDSFVPDAADHIALAGSGGPSGLVLDEANQRLYALTRFDNSVAIIDLNGGSVGAQVAQVPLHNPEPQSVVDGRPVLYDAQLTSSNGEASCASCHIFGDLDSLGWDLGDPDGDSFTNPNPFVAGGPGNPFHPNKGPMTTQSLRGMADHGPMHWRGDRTGGALSPPQDPLDESLAFNAFNAAFPGLIGRDEGELPTATMQAFTDFILQVTYPPNPIRPLDNTPSASAQLGETFYFNEISDGGTCNDCHTLDAAQGFFGGDGRSSFETETQEFKVAHLRNMYQKVGMFGLPDVPFVVTGDHTHQGSQIRGFGYLHDGSIDSLFRFVSASVFNFPGGDPQRRNVEQFMFEFPTTLAPIVGQQVSLDDPLDAAALARIDLMVIRAGTAFPLVNQPGATECDLVVKSVQGGSPRGGLYVPALDRFITDRAADPQLTQAQVFGLAAPGAALTFTCTPPGSGLRMGIDRDEDGVLDFDDNCPAAANPAQDDADGNGIGDACEVHECSDGLDNDGDGIFDAADPQCESPTDPLELCGFGPELGLLVPLLLWRHRRRRRAARLGV